MNNRILELREKKDVSQSQLADAIGVSRQAISLYERGDREPKLKTWQKMADYFGVSVGYLQGVTPIELPYSELKKDKDIAPLIDKLKNNVELNMDELKIVMPVIYARQQETAPQSVIDIFDFIDPREKHDINDFSNLKLAEQTYQAIVFLLETAVNTNKDGTKNHTDTETIELFSNITKGLQNYMIGYSTKDYFTPEYSAINEPKPTDDDDQPSDN